MCGNRTYTYANRLDPDQPPSYSVAGLGSNLFANQSIIPSSNIGILSRLLTAVDKLKIVLENYSLFKGLSYRATDKLLFGVFTQFKLQKALIK